MRDACKLIWFALVNLFWSRTALQAEILVLRHQLNVQRRRSPKRLSFSAVDRLIFAGLYRMVPSVLNALTIVKTGNRHQMASCRVSVVLALEVEATWWQAHSAA